MNPHFQQELKVDENSVFTAPTPNTPGPDPAFAAGNSSAGSSFSPFFGGSNPGDGFEGSGSAGPSSMQEGFGLEPGQMIEEGSKGRRQFSFTFCDRFCQRSVLTLVVAIHELKDQSTT